MNPKRTMWRLPQMGRRRTWPGLALRGLVLLAVLAAPVEARGDAARAAELPDAPSSSAWRLLGHDNLRSAILEIDPATGAARHVGPTGWDSRGSGMAFSRAEIETPMGVHPAGTLIAIVRDAALSADFLAAVELDTGRTEKLIPVQGLVPGYGLAFGGDGATIHLVDHGRRLLTLDVQSGQLTAIGPLVDPGGKRYEGANLVWDPVSGRFISVFETGEFAHELVALIDPRSGRLEPIATIVDRFSVCSIARSPLELAGPRGRQLPVGTLYFVDGRSGHLMAIVLDTIARRLVEIVDIGPLGPASSGSVCGAAFVRVTPATATPEPTRTATPEPTKTPTPTKPPEPSTTDTPVPEPTPTTRTCVCDRLRRQVPAAVIADALAQPARYNGWLQPLNPARPPGPDNPLRVCLALRNPNLAYHPLFNAPLWAVGCR